MQFDYPMLEMRSCVLCWNWPGLLSWLDVISGNRTEFVLFLLLGYVKFYYVRFYLASWYLLCLVYIWLVSTIAQLLFAKKPPRRPVTSQGSLQYWIQYNILWQVFGVLMLRYCLSPSALTLRVHVYVEVLNHLS